MTSTTERRFVGKEVTVSRQNARDWDTFLQRVTDDVKFTEAVRELCTPTGGTKVTATRRHQRSAIASGSRRVQSVCRGELE